MLVNVNNVLSRRDLYVQDLFPYDNSRGYFHCLIFAIVLRSVFNQGCVIFHDQLL